MAYVELDGVPFPLESGETVLECLERNGQEVACSCRSGICQQCLMRVEAGEAPAASTSPLSAAQRAQGYFLSCLCRPEAPLSISRIDPAKLLSRGRVLDARPLGARVVALRIEANEPIDFLPGQFFNIGTPEGVVRSYSAAEPPEPDGVLTFHIGRMPGGLFSTWAAEAALPGDPVTLQGPLGKCCHVPGEAHAPLLLAGTGTGLAPLHAIVKAAIAEGHPGPIWLFHGALDAPGLYFDDELQALAEAHPALQYRPCALNGGSEDGRIHGGNLQDHVFVCRPSLTGYRVYLCGHPDFVKPMQRRAFLAGASLQAIFSDPFLPSQAAPPAARPA